MIGLVTQSSTRSRDPLGWSTRSSRWATAPLPIFKRLKHTQRRANSLKCQTSHAMASASASQSLAAWQWLVPLCPSRAAGCFFFDMVRDQECNLSAELVFLRRQHTAACCRSCHRLLQRNSGCPGCFFSAILALPGKFFAGWFAVVERVALKTFLGVIMNVYSIGLSRTLAGGDLKLQLEFTTVFPSGTCRNE